LTEVISDVCQREEYHLLEARSSPDHPGLLVSLKPEQAVSRAIKMMKGNLSREMGQGFSSDKPVVGARVRLKPVAS
jgi:REP element-mobilizing transposase RayT